MEKMKTGGQWEMNRWAMGLRLPLPNALREIFKRIRESSKDPVTGELTSHFRKGRRFPNQTIFPLRGIE